MSPRTEQFVMSAEQKLTLTRVSKRKGLKQSDIAERLNINAASYSNKKSGNAKRGFTEREAKKIYEMLEKDPEVKFLDDYETQEFSSVDHVQTREQGHWNGLLNVYMSKLQVYLSPAHSVFEKSKLIQDLEDLVQKYSKNTDSEN